RERRSGQSDCASIVQRLERSRGTWWSQAGSNRRPLACHASALPAELWPPDHDGFGSDRSKIMNVIEFNISERDVGGKPHHTFPHPAPYRPRTNQRRGL